MGADLPDVRHQQAISLVKGLLGKFSDVRVLTEGELTFYRNRCFIRGWEVPGLCDNSDYKLRLVINKYFPFHPPRVAVWPAPPVLTWPNLEEHGVLCLLPESASASIYDPAAVVVSLLSDAQGLVSANMSGDCLDRFGNEFRSYWSRWKNTKARMSLLCHPEGPSRLVSAWYGEQLTIVAEDTETLQIWIRNRYGKNISQHVKSQSVPLIWLSRPPHPSEYPANVSALMSLLSGYPDSYRMVEQLLLDEHASFKSVVLGFDSQHGAGFAGLHICKPKTQKRSGNPLTNGFRSQPPDSILLKRYGAGKVVGATVTRYDPSWVHGRDHNHDVGSLVNKSVVVVGCGSLGSTVAELIAKSGIGKIRLVDHESLASENVSRHALGVNSVGLPKAVQLAQSLTARFPHLKISGHQETFEHFVDNKLDQLRSADLIISATGNWRTESYLNALFCKLEAFPPVLSCWLEPHSTGGHAIVLFKDQGCLYCLMDDLGKMLLPATVWGGKETMVPVPACGGLFQPYGAVELAHAHALAADLALDVLLEDVKSSTHRVWLAPKKLLDRTGGIWNPAWIEHHGDPNVGGVLRDIAIGKDPNCRECGAPR